MPKMVDLPGGEWANLHTSEEVPERKRRAHLKVQGQMLEAAGIEYDDEGKPIGMGKGVGASILTDFGDVKDALILAYVREWSFKKELTAEALLDLPSNQYDALHDACAAQAKEAVLDVSPEQALDPESPTVPLAE